MAKYIYPAVFTKEEGDMYSVVFPDLESCYTCGDNLGDALKMAADVLSLTLFEYERDGKTIPNPSEVTGVTVGENEFVNYVSADTINYQKRFNRKSVNKTVTLPEWLNDLATEANINFSKTLQDGLKAKLNIV